VLRTLSLLKARAEFQNHITSRSHFFWNGKGDQEKKKNKEKPKRHQWRGKGKSSLKKGGESLWLSVLFELPFGGGRAVWGKFMRGVY